MFILFFVWIFVFILVSKRKIFIIILNTRQFRIHYLNSIYLTRDTIDRVEYVSPRNNVVLGNNNHAYICLGLTFVSQPLIIHLNDWVRSLAGSWNLIQVLANNSR